MAPLKELLNPTASAVVHGRKPSWDEFAEWVDNTILNKPMGDSVTATNLAELKDGTLVELVEDSKNPGRTCFAIWKDGEVRFVDRLDQDGQGLMPLSRNDEVLARLCLPSAAWPMAVTLVRLLVLRSCRMLPKSK